MSLTESQFKSSKCRHQIVSLKCFLSSHFYVLIMSFTALFEDLRNQFSKIGKLFVMINLQSSLTVLIHLIITRSGRGFPLTLLFVALKRGQMLQRLQQNNILFTADKSRRHSK